MTGLTEEPSAAMDERLVERSHLAPVEPAHRVQLHDGSALHPSTESGVATSAGKRIRADVVVLNHDLPAFGKLTVQWVTSR